MVLADQFIVAEPGDPAKVMIGVPDDPFLVGDGNNGGFIERILVIGNFFQGFFEFFFRHFTGSDVGANGQVLKRFSICIHKRNDGGIHPVIRAVLGPVL